MIETTEPENREHYWLSPYADAVVLKWEGRYGSCAFDFSPGHIVFADPNAEDHHIKSCLEKFDEWTWDGVERPDEEFLAAVRGCLEELLTIPEMFRLDNDYEIKCIPEDIEAGYYSGESLEAMKNLLAERIWLRDHFKENHR